MKEFVLDRDGDLPLKFMGELLASVSSLGRGISAERWTVISIYKSKKGKFICQSQGFTTHDNERNKNQVLTCELEEDIIEFFGSGWLSKELYEKVGIEAVEEIE